MPSFATPVCLILALSQPDPLLPPPRGRDAGPTTAAPTQPAVKPVAPPPKPSDTKPPVAPEAAAVAKPVPGAAAQKPFEPEEEIIDDRTKGRKKTARKSAPPPVERTDSPDRKNTWAVDRYAAVVPPGLTLAALRSQLGKTQPAATEVASDRCVCPQGSDIEKAREALRQETARLEALIKLANNGGGIGMPQGDLLASPSPLSPAALREAGSEQIDSVSKAMKGMKPEQAAAVVARLDRGLAAEILRRMKASDAGSILGLLKPELAADLATEIATRKPTAARDKKGTGK